jgi:hypothetical protein
VVIGALHTVVETPDFIGDAKAAGMTDGERAALVAHLAALPESGDPIPGTGGARKLRWRRPGTGKSGGYRVVTFYSGGGVPVFLLNVFTKGDKIDLSSAERNELRGVLADLVDEYRKGARRNVQGR